MLKKFGKVAPAVLLALIFVLTIAGCSIQKRDPAAGGTNNNTNAEAETETTKAKTLEGKYKGQVDMTELISAESGVEVSTPIFMDLYLTINSDNTYNVNLDMEKFLQDSIAYYKEDMPGVIRQSMIDEGLPEDMLDQAVQDQGYADFNSFVNELIAQMITELEEQLDTENTVISTGTYEVEDSEINFTEEAGDDTFFKVGAILEDGSIYGVMYLDYELTEVTFVKQ